jgi:hypothetical protein
MLTNSFSLSKSKPDQIFEYFEEIFTEKQLIIINFLINQFRRNYVISNKEFPFPFLDVDFKSQIKNGTYYIAIN